MYKLQVWYINDDTGPDDFTALTEPTFDNGLVGFMNEHGTTTILPMTTVRRVDVIEISPVAPAGKPTTVDPEADKPIDFKPETHLPQ